MGALIINPPENTEASSSLRLKLPPLGILYIAAYLEKYEVPVEILDANLHEYTYEKAAVEACKKGPDIVGVTATTVTLGNALNIIRAVRQIRPETVTMIGGPHVTYTPSETLASCPELDVVVIGEGEVTSLELSKAVEGLGLDRKRQSSIRELARRLSGINGIAYRDPDNQALIRYTPPRPLIQDLDSIPFPARHLVPFDKYVVWNKNESAGMIMTSRGCPFACNYCISSRMAGIKFRGRSAKNVVDEVQLLHEEYGLKGIEFIDDLFMMSHKRAKEIALDIKSRGIDILWSASSRVNTINEDLIKELKKSGLATLYFGVESGSQRVLDLMNKRITLDQVRAAFKASRGNKIYTIGSFMLGYPGETLNEMKQTIKFAKEIDPDLAQFTILTPYPGTPVYDELKSSGLIEDIRWEAYTMVEPIIKYAAFGYSSEKVKRMLIRAYISYYLRPSYVLKHLDTLPLVTRIVKNLIRSNIL
jgi:anaerobic magnesium-protoporphyrin IX monomethyl ester cyclase